MEWLVNLRRSFLDFDAMAAVLPNMLFIGLKNTLILAFASTLFGVLVGIILAVMGISRSAWVRLPARIYTDIFRGLPAILTILIIGQGFARIGRQLFGPSPYPLGIIALSLIAGAYIGEIFRSGIQSVERGQMEACRALSMSYGQGMRLIVIPQGIRRVLPALVNQFIGNVKDSSLVYFLGLLASEREIFRVGQDQAVVITAEQYRILDFAGRDDVHNARRFHIDWDLSAAEKGGYDWFMRKEIYEQPQAVADTLLGRFDADRQLTLDEIRIAPAEPFAFVAQRASQAVRHFNDHSTDHPVFNKITGLKDSWGK